MAVTLPPVSNNGMAGASRTVSRAAAEDRIEQAPQQRKVPATAESRAAPAQETRQIARADQARQASAVQEKAFLTRQDLAAKAVREAPAPPPGKRIDIQA